MRSFALMALLVSASLVACVSEGADDGTSDEQDVHIGAMDGGTATADASASDGGTSTADAATDAGASDVPTYTEVAPMIATACGGCHHTSFNTLAKVKANHTRMLQMISSGRMPKNNPGWRNTADGQAVIDFLAHSPELP